MNQAGSGNMWIYKNGNASTKYKNWMLKDTHKKLKLQIE